MICRRGSTKALFEIDGLLKRYEKERVWTWFQEKLDNLDTEEKTQQEVCGNLFVILNHLEVLRDDWKGYVKEAKNMLLESELSAEQRKEFESVFTGEDHGTADGLFCIYLLLRGSLR